MSRALVGLGVLMALAFGLGISGAPGPAFGAAADWLTENGTVDLDGPVGEAVRDAF